MTLIGANGYLLTGTTVSGAGADVMDCRYTNNFGYLTYVTYSPSAILAFEASHDSTGWLRVLTVTGTPSSGTAQISAFYPYLRGVFVTGYSTTGSAIMHYAPGLQHIR